MTPRAPRFLRYPVFCILAFLLVLLSSISLFAQVAPIAPCTQYVAKSGNDSNAGTAASPWLTIQHAATTATAGQTVCVAAGVYNQYVSFPNSGTSGSPITFMSYPGQTAVIDGTGLSVSGTQGLITISGARSYITVQGFEIRNLSTTSKSAVPCGVWITGSGTGVQILNNLIHNIVSPGKGNGCGLFAYATSQTPITGLIINGNELYDLQTGESESMTMNGNVTHFQITNNLVHDNWNIGIDAIGYEKTGPTGYDQAMYGIVSGNTIYNISGIVNSGETDEYDADGLYCDGCAYVTWENNVVFQTDYGIETTSENQLCGTNGTDWPNGFTTTGITETGTPATGKLPCYGLYNTVRNNLFYEANSCGMSMGGYGKATTKGGGSNGGGSSYGDIFVNNTLYDNGAQPGNSDEGSPSGDYQIQYQVGSAQVDYFENNAVYSGPANIWINDYNNSTTQTTGTGPYPAPPATLNYNTYFSTAGYLAGTSITWEAANSYTSFANYQSLTGEDANSVNADPQFVALGNTPPDFDIETSSPAYLTGGTSLSCSNFWCDPNDSPTSVYGATDILGNARMQSGQVNIGAYQASGLSNSIVVTVTSSSYSLQGGQSTILNTTVSAIPGGAGTPSGTVSYMVGSTLLATQTLFPTGATTSADLGLPVSASQLAPGSNTITAVYSGNSVAPCCTPTDPPGGSQTPVAMYPSQNSSPITITETPTQTNTVTFTTPAPSSAEYGSNFTVVATGLGTGAITYTSDGVVCSNSGATYTMLQSSGTCTVTATQAEDSTYLSASASEYVTAEPAQGEVGVSLTSGVNPAYTGASVTFTATVTSDTGAVKGRKTTKRPKDLNGSVSWSGWATASTDCPTSSVSGNPPQTATCTTTNLPNGSDTVTATYTASDSNHTTGSGSIVETVEATNNTVTFTTPAPGSAEYGSSFTVAASGLGTGAITYTSDGVVCTNSGATYTMISGSGSCTVTATQAADSNYSQASASESVTAEPAQGEVSVALTSGSNPSNYGDSVTFTATVSSDTGAVKGRKTTKRPKDLNGSVAWSGNTGCSASAVSGNPPQTATCTTSALSGGTDTVTATYTASDSNHSTGSGSISQTVNATANTVTFTTPAPSSAEYGSSFTVAASGLGTGAITYTSDGVVCTNSGATYTMISGTGTCTVTATQAADANYGSANASESVTAAPAVGSVSVSLTSGSNPSTYGDSITFTATVTSDTGAVKGRKTTKRPKDLNGSVAWSGNTGCSASPVSGNPPQTATCTTSALVAGSNTVTATYTASDSNHTTGSGSVSQTVSKANQTITVSSYPTTATEGSSFTIVASASSGLAVTYTSGGSCTNSGATYTMNDPARNATYCTEDVFQSGNSNYNAAIVATEQTEVVAAIAPTVSVSAPASAAYGSTYTVTATTNASTTPTFTATPATVCSISGSTVTMLSGMGMCTVKASWPADDTYKAATATAKTTAAKIAPTVTFTGAPGSAAYLSTFTVSTTENNSVTPTMTATPASVCAISSGTVTMKSGTGTCTTTAKWAATTDYEAATLTQTTTAEMLATTTTITNTTAAANPLKVTVDFSVSNGTATPVVGSVTVRASSGETCTGTATAGHCLITFVSADAGSQTLTAAYASNANNSASTSASYPITVQ